MKIFLDDIREAPAGWQRVFWPEEAIALLEKGEVTHISLDHDLGDDERGTGYDVIAWIEEAVVTRGFIAPEITIHSANPVGRERMLRGIACRLGQLARARGADDTSRRRSEANSAS